MVRPTVVPRAPGPPFFVEYGNEVLALLRRPCPSGKTWDHREIGTNGLCQLLLNALKFVLTSLDDKRGSMTLKMLIDSGKVTVGKCAMSWKIPSAYIAVDE